MKPKRPFKPAQLLNMEGNSGSLAGHSSLAGSRGSGSLSLVRGRERNCFVLGCQRRTRFGVVLLVLTLFGQLRGGETVGRLEDYVKLFVGSAVDVIESDSLSGTMPPDVGKLTALTKIELMGKLSGESWQLTLTIWLIMPVPTD